VGEEAIGGFLLKLQVFKSLADIESARKLIEKYSEVSDSLENPYLKYRDIVIARRKVANSFSRVVD
jgi:dipeptidyl-peptidase-3